MNDIEKRARELLAREYEKGQFRAYAPEIRGGSAGATWNEEVRAVIAALTPPDGFVLVPESPTAAMCKAGRDEILDCAMEDSVYYAMLAARPEVSP